MVNLAAFYDGPTDQAVRQAWVDRFAAALQQDDHGAYVNFLSDEGPARVRQAYPGPTWQRLATSSAATTPTTCSTATRTSHPPRREPSIRLHAAVRINLVINEPWFLGLAVLSAIAGWKDTVFLPSGATVRLQVRFTGYTGPALPYMFHCHLLRHEDNGMMGQFVVVGPGQAPSSPQPHQHLHVERGPS